MIELDLEEGIFVLDFDSMTCEVGVKWYKLYVRGDNMYCVSDYGGTDHKVRKEISSAYIHWLAEKELLGE